MRPANLVLCVKHLRDMAAFAGFYAAIQIYTEFRTWAAGVARRPPGQPWDTGCTNTGRRATFFERISVRSASCRTSETDLATGTTRLHTSNATPAIGCGVSKNLDRAGFSATRSFHEYRRCTTEAFDGKAGRLGLCRTCHVIRQSVHPARVAKDA